MTPEERLNELYIQVGSMTGPIDPDLDIFKEIQQLEKIVHPPVVWVEPEEEIVNLCGAPGCNGYYCWECAAIRGGCPEDV